MWQLLFTRFAATIESCQKGSFFGLKPWYQYLPLNDDCSIGLKLSEGPSQWNQLWLIGVVIFEDLLRIAGLVAFGFIIYGGIRYITSQGEPDNPRQALHTILNAVIGLAIAIIGSVVVAYIGNKLGGGLGA